MEFPKINWFPGHMKVATDAIKNICTKVDAVLEVVDSRGIEISSNNDLRSLIPNRPIIKIALKNDLADDVGHSCQNENIVFANKYQKNLRNLILQKLNNVMQEKTQKLKNKGLLLPNYNIAVIGLPNVGKSTLINVLVKRTKAKVENRPGVTRSIMTIKLNEMFNLLDTPGVLYKKIEDFEVGAKLTLMGIIKSDVVPLHDILVWAYDFLINKYPNLLMAYCPGWQVEWDYELFLTAIAKKRNLVISGGQYDLNHASQIFYQDIMNGTIGKLNYE